ncbi:MAG: alpha/beta hydrolase [Acidobacteriia bacterium]|nr:alpha/beta hydrolase [Terriglobia bacterium]
MTSRSPELVRIDVNGVNLAVWDWAGEDPPLVFTHGSGFHGRCWDEVIRHLPGRRCLAVDARGHGQSAKPEPPYPWTLFAADLAELLAKLEIRNAIGVGHSLGGHTITAAAAERPESFSALLLLDPTIWEVREYGSKPLNTFIVRRRRDRWPSPDVMFESLSGRPPFERWNQDVLRDYCNYGLLLRDGEYWVACPPHIEASAHECAKDESANIHPVIPSIKCPVTIMRAGTSARRFFNPEPSPTDPELAKRFPNGTDVFLREISHFIPMELPEMVAEHICGMLALSESRQAD